MLNPKQRGPYLVFLTPNGVIYTLLDVIVHAARGALDATICGCGRETRRINRERQRKGERERGGGAGRGREADR